MPRTRVLGGFATLLLVAACSDQASNKSPVTQKPQPSPLPVLAPSRPAQTPELPATHQRDTDGNRLDDVLDEQMRQAGERVTEPLTLQVLLSAPVEQAELDDFIASGGKVRYLFRELSYGWTGTLPSDKLQGWAARWSNKLHLVAAPSVIVPFMDEATRTGRVRGIWAASFAGNPAGYSGNSNTTIAVLDTGVDASHTDLNGRMQGWHDYTSDVAVTARDVQGHGTHVASIVVGTGAAFAATFPTLNFTQSGSLNGIVAGSFLAAPVHTPKYLGSAATLSASASATFLGGPSTTLHLLHTIDGGGAATSFLSTNGTSPLSLSKADPTSDGVYQAGLVQSTPAAVTNFAVTNALFSYPNVGDGFNALRGVAPTCKWFGAKVFIDSGAGNSFDIEEALDDVVLRKATDHIKVANLSLGVTGSGTDTVLRAKVNSTVDAGVVVVVAAGNDGPSNTIGDPGLASKVITVGAANDVNQLTTYTSIGVGSPDPDSDTKPDLVAPGGSAYRSGILAADTNTADGNVSGFGDLIANDYSSMQGTSMATPFVSGSIALMIDALEQSGTAWSFGSSAQPLFLKMLLAASATELNMAREQAAPNSPTLGRVGTAKDRFEGYGIINPDAAIEAMVQTFVSPLTGSVSNTLPARLEWERRAWGRKLSLVNGATVNLNLAVPITADYDLYLYAGSADAKGNPVIRASSVKAAFGTNTATDETISFTSSATETAYVFVKRVSGYGAFSLTGSAVSHCNNGVLDAGELCDPAIAGSSACCTATCASVTNGTSCDDGNKCTKSDTCQAGSCSSGSAVTCPASDQCHDAGSCDTLTGACSNPKKTDGASCDDGDKCTPTDTCLAGACKAGGSVTCTASDQCHDVSTCNSSTGACSNPTKTNGTACNDNNKCTQTDTCVAGACSGANAVVCAALDQCHAVGTCDSATGACSNPNKTNGTTCNDNNKCTQSDTCVAGTCSGANPITCVASDQCHVAGTCDSATGICSNPNKSNGATCSDGNQCTQTDTCVAGSCTGANPVTCAAPDQCHTVGSCDTTTGVCAYPKKTDGVACDDGSKCTQTDTCVAGTCTGASPVVCAAGDQCHAVGACDAATGACSHPAKADGTSCNDGNFCTMNDACAAGACTRAAVVCVASDQCHDAGVCDPGSGTCTSPLAAAGTSCDDGDACTLGDACDAGACMAGGDVTCAARDACHEAGTCQSPGGTCNYVEKPDGVACGDDGAVCVAGVCVAPGGDGGAGGQPATAGAPGDGGVPGTGGSGNASGGAPGESATGGDAQLAGANGVAAASGAPAAGAADAESLAGSSPVTAGAAETQQASGCGCQAPGSGRGTRGTPLALLLVGASVLGRRRFRAGYFRASSAGSGRACS